MCRSTEETQRSILMQTTLLVKLPGKFHWRQVGFQKMVVLYMRYPSFAFLVALPDKRIWDLYLSAQLLSWPCRSIPFQKRGSSSPLSLEITSMSLSLLGERQPLNLRAFAPTLLGSSVSPFSLSLGSDASPPHASLFAHETLPPSRNTLTKSAFVRQSSSSASICNHQWSWQRSQKRGRKRTRFVYAPTLRQTPPPQ